MVLTRLPPTASFVISAPSSAQSCYALTMLPRLWVCGQVPYHRFHAGSCPQIHNPLAVSFPLRSSGNGLTPFSSVLPTKSPLPSRNPTALGARSRPCLAPRLGNRLRSRKPPRDHERQQEDHKTNQVSLPSPWVTWPGAGLKLACHKGPPRACPRLPAAWWAGRSRRCPELVRLRHGQVSQQPL